MIALNVVAVPGFMRHDIPAPATVRKFTYLYILPAEPLQMAEELPFLKLCLKCPPVYALLKAHRESRL